MAVVDSDAVRAFEAMKMGASKDAWLLLTVRHGVIGVDSAGAAGGRWADFVAALPDSAPRWGVTHFSYDTASGARRTKLVMVNWCPAGAGRRERMEAALWAQKLRQALQGVHVFMEAGSREALAPAAALERCARFERDAVAWAAFAREHGDGEAAAAAAAMPGGAGASAS